MQSLRVLSIAAGLIIGVSDASAKVIHVPADQPTIQAAVDAAREGDEVVLADGVYTGEGNRNVAVGEKNIHIRSMNSAGSCIIDCQRQGRAFFLTAIHTPAMIIEGLTIRHGGPASSLDGGAISIVCVFPEVGPSEPVIRDCRFEHNEATFGGAIYGQCGAAPTIERCVFIDNFGYGGSSLGIIPVGALDNHIRVVNCRFHGGKGIQGAIYGIYGLLFEVDNCVFSGNESWPFFLQYACSLKLTNSTLVGSVGDIVAIYNGPFTSTTVANTIFHNYFLPVASRYDPVSIDYSVVNGGAWGEGNIDADPAFVDLNGPDGVLGTEDDNLRLRFDSPCVDAGSNEAVPADLTVDADGNPRIVDGDSDRLAVVDMGAFEFRLGDLNGDGVINGFDLALLLGAWGRCFIPEGCAADLDGSGSIDGVDLALLLGAWG